MKWVIRKLPTLLGSLQSETNGLSKFTRKYVRLQHVGISTAPFQIEVDTSKPKTIFYTINKER